MKSKSLSYDGGQPWLARSCQIVQREQSGSSQALWTELCTTGDMTRPVTTTSLTLRLTQQCLTTTALSLWRAMRRSLCSHQVSNCPVCSKRVGVLSVVDGSPMH